MKKDEIEFIARSRDRSLENLDITLKITSNNRYRSSLMNVWNELLNEFPVLLYFYSDYIEPVGDIQNALNTLDELKIVSKSKLSISGGKNRWYLLCSKYFFEKELKDKKAVLLHEIGHIIVFEFEIFKGLNSLWNEGMTLFNVYSSIIKKRKSIFNKNESFFREFYYEYLMDVLRMPDELYADLWVKKYCRDYFHSLIEGYIKDYMIFDKIIRKKIKNRLFKYIIIYSILKHERLLMILEEHDKYYSDIIQNKNLLYMELKEIMTEKNFNNTIEIIEKIKKICFHPEEVNLKFFGIFHKFVNLLKMQPQDLMPYP